MDIEVFDETSKIMQKLKQRDCQEALNWCNTHKTKLQKSSVNFAWFSSFFITKRIESVRVQTEIARVHLIREEQLAYQGYRVLSQAALQVWR